MKTTNESGSASSATSSADQPTDLWRWDASALAAAINSRKISSREATQAVLDRIIAVNGHVNAVSSVDAETVLKAADKADEAVANGATLGRLHGVPVTIKESADLEGIATTIGVTAFKDSIAQSDSPAVAGWRRAGAVLLASNNMPEFGMRLHTDSALHGPTINPWNANLTPGGSSGGAAAALAVGIAPLALGSDLAGSIRFPAYCCGVVGLRPTFGRVPMYNATSLKERAPGMQIMTAVGPMARTVRDVRLGLREMIAADARDVWWVPAPLQGPPMKWPMRVALTLDPTGAGMHPDVANAIRAAADALTYAGYIVEEVELPSVKDAADCYLTIIGAELRTDMIPFMKEHGASDSNRALDFFLANMPETDLPGYMKALSERARFARDWMTFLERYPLILGPVCTQPAFEVGFDLTSAERTNEALQALNLTFISPFIGVPSISVPIGTSKGAPLGVQIIAPKFREDLCLDAAEEIEKRAPGRVPIEPQFAQA